MADAIYVGLVTVPANSGGWVNITPAAVKSADYGPGGLAVDAQAFANIRVVAGGRVLLRYRHTDGDDATLPGELIPAAGEYVRALAFRKRVEVVAVRLLDAVECRVEAEVY